MIRKNVVLWSTSAMGALHLAVEQQLLYNIDNWITIEFVIIFYKSLFYWFYALLCVIINLLAIKFFYDYCWMNIITSLSVCNFCH